MIDTGAVYTWGCGSDGQLGLGNTLSQYTPQEVIIPGPQGNTASYAIDISCGWYHTGIVLSKLERNLFKF